MAVMSALRTGRRTMDKVQKPTNSEDSSTSGRESNLLSPRDEARVKPAQPRGSAVIMFVLVILLLWVIGERPGESPEAR
jgi:hypothetical protein